VNRSVPRILTAALLAAVAAGAACCGSGTASDAKGQGPLLPVVEVLRITPETIPNDAELMGQLEPEDSVMVRSEMAGIVDSVDFREGEPVEKGQVLFRLKDGEQRARLHEAEAELRLAEDSHRRTRGLAERNVVADAQLERVTAELEAARARLEFARVSLARTEIVAPFDGLAAVCLVSVGSRLEPETDLVQVDALSTLELVFTLPEEVLPLARTGIPIELAVAPFPGERFPGEISFVAPSLNPRTRQLLVKGRVPNADLRLRPGLFAKVYARIGDREKVIMLPADAVVQGSEGGFVWRLDENDVAQAVDVEVGLRQGGRVEIRSGLAPGDDVVVAGTNKLGPGVRVERATAAPAAGTAAETGTAPAEAATDSEPAEGDAG
jgi:membrane fusion protein (multidrug efflux system)